MESVHQFCDWSKTCLTWVLRPRAGVQALPTPLERGRGAAGGSPPQHMQARRVMRGLGGADPPALMPGLPGLRTTTDHALADKSRDLDVVIRNSLAEGYGRLQHPAVRIAQYALSTWGSR